MDNKVSIRFIIDRKHQYVSLFDLDETFKSVEEYLLSKKPIELFNDNSTCTGFKFLYSGKLFNGKQTVKNLKSTQTKLPLNCQLIPIKKSTTTNNNASITTTEEQQQQQQTNSNMSTATDNFEFHFHSCLFDYEEFKKIEEIYNRKEDPNEKVIKLSFLNQFLHSYYAYLVQHQPELVNNNNDNGSGNNNFPIDKLSSILRNVLKASSLNGDTKITKIQFRIIFFLFTSNIESNQICPNGQYTSCLEMIKQYHPTIDSNNSFDLNEFDNVFKLVLSIQPSINNNNNSNNSNSNNVSPQISFKEQSLTCKNVELLFYLYTADIVMKLDEKNLNSSSPVSSSSTTTSI